MPRRLRIATVQSPVTINPAANGATLRDLMRRAYDEGARLVHMPEGAVSGYVGGDKPYYRGWDIDWKPLGTELDEIAELAAGLGLWVVAGSHHRLTPPNRPHNSLYVISDQGVLVNRYDKRYLSASEVDEFFTPGREPVTFTVDGFTFGLLLCIEVNFPELWTAYAEAGVDCILFSSYSEDPIFETIARGHAATTTAWVSVSVPAQVSHAMPAGVIGPHGDWLATGNRSGLSDLVCVDLDDSDPRLHFPLHAARPWRAVAREGGVYDRRMVDDPRSHERATF
ncbi:putative amidohydrolase [Hamadaea flava]|uniref:Carbon-nitrogen hydrolase family protein n=1 Tax=Hamadaea flava TaxID=1742688 RepID=A0ABV8LZD6_9ACTN|nr:carbon-nitrogen hydrolase family protein [Hamadaea flava]MCP2324424.1 putative amidohydrolase [Hamadaea flava]